MLSVSAEQIIHELHGLGNNSSCWGKKKSTVIGDVQSKKALSTVLEKKLSKT